MATWDVRHLDAAIAQVLGTHTRVFDADHGLLRHAWDLRSRAPAGEFWGRGNGWTVFGPRGIARGTAEGSSAAGGRAHGLRAAHAMRPAVGGRAGGWHQILDRADSWLETSATGMLICGLARGVNEGWLDTSSADVARQGWRALQAKGTPEGDLLDVRGSTDTGDVTYYLDRPRLRGDLHGFGSYLLAGAEIVRIP